MDYYYLDGRFLSTNAGISPFDLSIHRSYAVFDYCVFKEGVILLFEDYLKRFISSIENMGIEILPNLSNLKEACYSLIEKNQLTEGGLKLIMTGGSSPNAYTYVKSSLMIFTLPIPSYPKEFYRLGLPLISLNHVRQFPTIKSTNYFVSLAYRKLLSETGAEDFIYHYNNRVSESSRSNIFMVKDGIIKTSENDILFGITRKYAIELAEKKYSVQRVDLSLKDFYEADEVFLTSTTKKIMPVSSIDHVQYKYSNESICLKLLKDLEDLHKNYIVSNKA